MQSKDLAKGTINYDPEEAIPYKLYQTFVSHNLDPDGTVCTL